MSKKGEIVLCGCGVANNYSYVQGAAERLGGRTIWANRDPVAYDLVSGADFDDISIENGWYRYRK